MTDKMINDIRIDIAEMRKDIEATERHTEANQKLTVEMLQTTQKNYEVLGERLNKLEDAVATKIAWARGVMAAVAIASALGGWLLKAVFKVG